MQATCSSFNHSRPTASNPFSELCKTLLLLPAPPPLPPVCRRGSPLRAVLRPHSKPASLGHVAVTCPHGPWQRILALSFRALPKTRCQAEESCAKTCQLQDTRESKHTCSHQKQGNGMFKELQTVHQSGEGPRATLSSSTSYTMSPYTGQAERFTFVISDPRHGSAST